MTAAIVLLVALLLPLSGSFDELLDQLHATSPPERNRIVREYLQGRPLPVMEKDSVLTFVWYGQADSVYVNGSLQWGWRRPERMDEIPCGSDSVLFYKRYIVSADALLEYQFMVDGHTILDPGNVRTTPDGDFRNSQVAMPKFRPSRWTLPDPAVPRGRIDTLAFTPSDTTLRARRVFIYVPTGVPPRGGYPLACVHDGETALHFLSLTTIADNMIGAGEVPPFVAVFVPSVERGDEYAGIKQVRYLNALADELVPLIEKRYGTTRDPFRRASMGISGGGHFALLSPLMRSDVFGLCAGQSSTIEQDLLVALDLRKRYARLPAQTRIFQQVGRFDIITDEYSFARQNRLFASLLAQAGVHHRFVESSDGHDWPSWRERLPDILRFLFKPNKH
jgi:enterochelin esterase-like enzyme